MKGDPQSMFNSVHAQNSDIAPGATDSSADAVEHQRECHPCDVSRCEGRQSRAIEAVYDRYSSFYDWLFGPVLDPGRKLLAARASELAPAQLLEVGVGTGLTIPYYDPTIRLVGIDLSSRMLAKARVQNVEEKMCDQVTPRLALLRMNAEYLAFADEVFDCVCMPYVVSTVSRPRELLREVVRVTRPGGTILVLNHFAGSLLWRAGERLVAPLRGIVGFQTSLDMGAALSHPSLETRKVTSVNLVGLSKLVELGRK